MIIGIQIVVGGMIPLRVHQFLQLVIVQQRILMEQIILHIVLYQKLDIKKSERTQVMGQVLRHHLYILDLNHLL